MNSISTEDQSRLLDAAQTARLNAHSPYSNFQVGASLLCEDGSIISGCNVENASFGATICAERSAVCSAVSTGQKSFTAIAIVSSSTELITACGMCLQVLSEFCDDLPVVLANRDNSRVSQTSLRAMMPVPPALKGLADGGQA